MALKKSPQKDKAKKKKYLKKTDENVTKSNEPICPEPTMATFPDPSESVKLPPKPVQNEPLRIGAITINKWLSDNGGAVRKKCGRFADVGLKRMADDRYGPKVKRSPIFWQSLFQEFCGKYS